VNFAHTRVGRNPLTTAGGVPTLAVVGFGGGPGMVRARSLLLEALVVVVVLAYIGAH